jgi:hypothetical protein
MEKRVERQLEVAQRTVIIGAHSGLFMASYLEPNLSIE